MGRQLLSAVAERQDALLGAAIDIPGPSVGLDSSVLSGGDPTGVLVSASAAGLPDDVDVVVDFTRPEATLHLLSSLPASCAVVIGTTGFDNDQLIQLKEAAAHRPVVFAANYSIGVTLCLTLLHQAAQALGDDYDVEVIEAHHRHKVDAPSGTALALGQVLADALGRNLSDCAVYGREGITGERDTKTIGFETIRAGDIIGEHTVLFAGNGERIEITHRATDRMTFARGAIHAAAWLKGKTNGLYDMRDVLGLTTP
ncbi:MAG: 4-hydroxy-tetrahydrodipicolinate reductase [Gammaproteobacteria bacterium]|nr:4-hydroxy-tetrahydrodipicolinate reductase [Gammaproteobacteria bacterium]